MTQRPFPLAALVRRCGIDPHDPTWPHQLATQVRMSRSTVWRHRDGLSCDEADTWAARAGFHPSEVWPAWWSGLTGAALANACRERCGCGAVYDRTDARGWRYHSGCLRDRVARFRENHANTQVTAHVTERDREAS